MKRPGRLRALVAGAAALAALQLTTIPGAAAVPGTACPVFPANNIWNTDISGLAVNTNSAAWLAATGGAGRNLHPDFGPSGDPNLPYGIPFAVVDSSHPRVNVTFQYAGESDKVPYPLGPDTPIEGGAASGGDRHALMIDKSSCTLYELYDTHYSAGGSNAGSGAVFDLKGNALRPAGWTSADAAGLPIFPGLLRLDEVNSGAVNHAIRFTVQRTAAGYLWPARHQAGSGSAAVNPPMGARFRMRPGVDISHFSLKAQVILRAFKHYGLVVADNGSNWYFQGDANNAWPDSLLSELKSIPAGEFEAVDESSLMVDPNSAQARQTGGGGGGPLVPPPPVKALAPVRGPGTAPAPGPVVAGASGADPAAPAADLAPPAAIPDAALRTMVEDHFPPPNVPRAAAQVGGPVPRTAGWLFAGGGAVLFTCLAAALMFRRRTGPATRTS